MRHYLPGWVTDTVRGKGKERQKDVWRQSGDVGQKRDAPRPHPGPPASRRRRLAAGVSPPPIRCRRAVHQTGHCQPQRVRDAARPWCGVASTRAATGAALPTGCSPPPAPRGTSDAARPAPGPLPATRWFRTRATRSVAASGTCSHCRAAAPPPGRRLYTQLCTRDCTGGPVAVQRGSVAGDLANVVGHRGRPHAALQSRVRCSRACSHRRKSAKAVLAALATAHAAARGGEHGEHRAGKAIPDIPRRMLAVHAVGSRTLRAPLCRSPSRIAAQRAAAAVGGRCRRRSPASRVHPTAPGRVPSRQHSGGGGGGVSSGLPRERG